MIEKISQTAPLPTATLAPITKRAVAGLVRGRRNRTGRIHGQQEIGYANSSAAKRRSRKRVWSIGAWPRRSRSRRCWPPECRFAHRSRHRTRHVQPSSRGAARSLERREVRPAAASRRSRRRRFEIHNSRSPNMRALGFEYGYCRRGAEVARALGSAVRRLQQRRADHHRSVHRRGCRQSGAQTSRLTLLLPHGYEGAGAGTLERAARAFLAALGRREHSRRLSVDRGAITSICCASRRVRPSPVPLVIMTPKSLLRNRSRGRLARRAGDGFVPRGDRRPERDSDER